MIVIIVIVLIIISVIILLLILIIMLPEIKEVIFFCHRLHPKLCSVASVSSCLYFLLAHRGFPL